MKQYIFDFDGTLVDSMPFWSNTHINMLKRNGVSVPVDFVQTITPMGNVKAGEYAISLGVNISLNDYLKQVSYELQKGYSAEIELKPNVKSKLINLLDKGYGLNVLTASPHSYVDSCLERLGIYNLFDNIWTIEDMNNTKAEIITYKKTAEMLKCDIENCVLVDDNITAIMTAKKAGMGTVGVYDSLSDNYWIDIKKCADSAVKDFSEII